MATDVDSFWQCECGYTNAGSDRCMICNARPLVQRSVPTRSPSPDHADPTDGPWNAAEFRRSSYAAPRTARGAGSKATWTVVKIVVLMVVLQIATLVVVALSGMNGLAAFGFILLTQLAYYGFVALWALGRSAELGVRAHLLQRRRLAWAAAEGALVGGGVALLLTLVVRVATGRPQLDSLVAGLASEGGAILLLGVLLIVVAAPIVEELVFRGFFAEVFRRRGKWVAVLLSAVAFSLAHLAFFQFPYYFVMGVVFGLLYWRGGLVSSVAAHALFNGMLIVFAVAVVTKPPAAVDAAGSRLTLPGNWQTVDAHGVDVRAVGPLGAQFLVAHEDLPRGMSARTVAAMVQAPSPPGADPLIDVESGSVAVIQLPAGEAVSFRGSVRGLTGRGVLVPDEERLWLALVQSAGSPRAERDFQEIVESWVFP